jgi:hypothetical protein
MDRCDRPVLRCLLATATLALAPVCMAQERPAAAADVADAANPTVDTPDSTEAERSPFGKVMSLLISALQENAEASTGAATPVEDAGLQLQPAAAAASAPSPAPARDIQVSAAFRLGPATKPAPDRDATASID